MPTIEDRVDDLTVIVPGKRRLKARWWRRPRPRGVLVVAHGFGEHSGAYAHTAETIVTTARRLEEFPRCAAMMREGQLSLDQVDDAAYQ